MILNRQKKNSKNNYSNNSNKNYNYNNKFFITIIDYYLKTYLMSQSR